MIAAGSFDKINLRLQKKKLKNIINFCTKTCQAFQQKKTLKAHIISMKCHISQVHCILQLGFFIFQRICVDIFQNST